MKKTKRNDRRILAAALVVAGVTVAGSTFAWFTSKDEVTNRLSAVGEYGVAIAEDFTPPDDWVPGQTVKKEAKAVNTGNVDAFVRMWLTGTMNLISNGEGMDVNTFAAKELEPSNMGSIFTTKEKNGTNYFRELTEDERKAMQTGDLVYAENSYKFTSNITGEETTGTAHTDCTLKSVDSESFTPTDTGLFIFSRKREDATEYSGYYYIKENATEGKYYALVTNSNGENTNVFIKDLTNLSGDALKTAITGGTTVKIRNATETTIANNNLTWTYTTPADAAASPFGNTNPYYVVSLKTPGANQDSIKINIELTNVGDGSKANEWQKITKAGKPDTFYYTNDLEAGANTTSSPLVANINLDNGVKEGSYVAFDFDLDVHLESVQLVLDNNGKELATPVAATAGWAATKTGGTDDEINVGASGAATMDTTDTKEIGIMKWSALS